MGKLNRIQSAIHQLIEKFIGRLPIVLEAMRDVRPDLVMEFERTVDPNVWQDLRRKYMTEGSNTGLWGPNNEWEYRFHGIGCHLTNTSTGEIIGWDIGSLRRFDWHWFVDYLDWLLKSNDRSESVEVIRSEFKSGDIYELRDLVQSILVELETVGILRSVKHRYVLIRNGL